MVHSGVVVGASRFGGLGLMARRNIEEGDVILVESPFLTVEGVEWEDQERALANTSASSAAIRGEVAKLDREAAAAFWSFGQAPAFGDEPTAQGIFWTNCIDVDPTRSGACMFRLTCRLNHACVPNVRWTYDAEKRHIYTRAIMDIREGEELFVTYMRPEPDGHYDAPADKDTTLREYLLKFYGFECQCGQCDQVWASHLQRLAEAAETPVQQSRAA